MLEIEIKAYCNNHKELTKRVISLGAKFLVTKDERDIYLKHPCRDFGKTDEALRVRIECNKNILTYKGPRIGSSSTKTRFEEEVEFNNFDSMMSILFKLGFVVFEEVVKTRDIYLVNGIEICIDRVEGVGNFVELEKRGMDRVKVEEELFSLAKKLDLSRFETRSYLELKIDKNKKIGS